jgi:hypothetical protein
MDPTKEGINAARTAICAHPAAHARHCLIGFFQVDSPGWNGSTQRFLHMASIGSVHPTDDSEQKTIPKENSNDRTR